MNLTFADPPIDPYIVFEVSVIDSQLEALLSIHTQLLHVIMQRVVNPVSGKYRARNHKDITQRFRNNPNDRFGNVKLIVIAKIMAEYGPQLDVDLVARGITQPQRRQHTNKCLAIEGAETGQLEILGKHSGLDHEIELAGTG